MISGRREVRLLPRPHDNSSGILGRGTLALTQRRDGSSPSPGTHARASSPTGRGHLLKPGLFGVRISGRARHSPDARVDERSFSKREAAGSNPAGASKRTEAIGLPRNEPRRVPSSAFSPGYPNQQRTPAQTRCVAGANPVPGTNVTSRTGSVTTVNGEVAGSNPAGRKPVAQWESANAERGHHVRDASTGRPPERSTALHTARRGFDSRPLHDRQPNLRSPRASRRLMVTSRGPSGQETCRPRDDTCTGSNPAA